MIVLDSSDLGGAHYDNWSGTLIIEFNSGGVYEYYNVPRPEYVGLLRASSHGEYFHAHIKNRYSCRKIAG
jgi:KTSC domain